MEEFEVKFLNIDTNIIESKLKTLGAKKEFDRIYKRRVFDYPDLRLNNQGAYLRLRDEADKVTLTFKKRLGMGREGKNDKGMQEIEIIVSDFKRTAELLLNLGLAEKFLEENRRIRYTFNDIEFDLDFWPLIKPYLEIEARTSEKVDEGIKLLGLNPKEKKIFSTMQIYELNGIRELDYRILTFAKQIKRGFV
ncbi:MAG: CYTH domain-containing protein [Patescibacteria group bacterium]|nr:CYTH domain-containing protein [Patescibacteria group bacterium]